MKFISIKINN